MERIVLFDGVCNFCNASVNFIIGRDGAGRFKFAPLQSEIGRALREKHRIAEDVDSIILIEGGKAYVRSEAALRIARGLGGAWPLLYGLRFVPGRLRDWAYGQIAKNRYRWFGKKDVCMMPTPEVRGRFIV
jgi:predicted DCC family thiol-disulfide oxidoreductase YuxK